MNYYNYNKRSQYKGVKKRRFLNILIIIIFILAVVAFSLVLGNNLKKKSENSGVSTEPIETLPPESDKNEPDEREMNFKNERAYEDLASIGGYLDLTYCPDEKSAENYVDYLSEVGYTGIVFKAFSDNGKLAYASHAVSDITGVEVPANVLQSELLMSAVSRAKANGMKTICIIPLPDVSSTAEKELVRRTVIKNAVVELGNMGFSQFIFTDALKASDFTSSRADVLFPFVSEIRGALPGADIGMELESSILDDPELTPVLELIFRFCDFFAVGFSDSDVWSADAVSAFLSSHSGSMSAYNMKAFSASSTPEAIAEHYALFTAAGKANVSFIEPLEYTVQTDDDGSVIFASKMIPYTVESGIAATDETTGGDE